MSRVEGQIEAAVSRGQEELRAQAEGEVSLSRGQTPTIDSEIYDPKELQDAGYPLANPTTQPNGYTREGARHYGNRDASDGTPVNPITALPDPATRSPQAITYMTRSDSIFNILGSAETDVDTEMGLTNLYKQYMDFTNSRGEVDTEEEFDIARHESRRLILNTADRLDKVGFDHINRSEYTEEGINDTGMNGLQMIYAAGIFRSTSLADISFEQIYVGETGANNEQLEEAFDRAMLGVRRAQYNVINELPKTNEEAMADPRYAGSVRTLLAAGGRYTDEELSNMPREKILSEGKWMADLLKSNLAALPLAAYDIASNPDSPMAEALTFLLQSDENLPFEMADAGRWALGIASDPTTYLGGYGIWSKLLSRKGSAAVLARLGVGATFGAGVGAGYGALYDLGMQNIDMAARNQRGFDLARFGQNTALGATFGYVLGGAIGMLPKAKGLVKDMYARLKSDKPSALDDFGADIIPENELVVRRQLREFMEEDKLRKMADDEELQQEFIRLANEASELEEARRLKVIEGGKARNAPDDPDHIASMELVNGVPLKDFPE